MSLTINSRLCIAPIGRPPVIRVGQYDSNFEIEFEMYTIEPITWDLEEGTTAMIRGTKTDKRGYSADCDIDIENKKVTVYGDIQMTAAAGPCVYEIVLKKNNKEISSINFTLQVERAALDADTIPSESKIKEIQDIGQKADEIIEAYENLQFDSTPTAGSTKAVTSGGIKTYVDEATTTDTTLSETGKPADAEAVGDALGGKVDEPGTAGTAGQFLQKGENGNQWVDVETDVDATLTQEGVPADAKAVGDEVTDLKSALVDCFQIEYSVNPNTTTGKTIDATTGNIVDSSNFSVFDPIPVKKGQTVTLTAKGYLTNVVMIATCNADNTERSMVVRSVDSNEHDYKYIVLEDGYITGSFLTNYGYKLSLTIDYYSLYQAINNLTPIYVGSKTIQISPYANGFIDPTTNRFNSSNSFKVSNSVQMYKDQTVKLTAKGYNTNVGMINLYDSTTDTYQCVVRSIDSTLREYTYTATENCVVRFCYLIESTLPIALMVTNDNDFIRIINIENDVKALQSDNSEGVEYPKFFTNVVCVGDSLTYGHDGNTRVTENYPYYFGKLADVEVDNEGLSGRTTKQWWDELGSTFDHFADFDCAIIYLGTNGGLTDTVDTDCNIDYTQNADTSTGCYGKIIGKIKNDAPNCKIFCVAGPSEYLDRDSSMNPAVRNLSSFYGVGLIDLSGCLMDDNGTTTSAERYLYRPVDGIHYNRLGYFTLANMIYDYMKTYISNHLSWMI